ncbi:hypothetical protein F511_15190 [Dorcoceras hygrometricum]|uniref:MADS-box domain-containing protein n=1 Tax=Dorcoceras hygrometricum TaxID=472368 RepID=A0A2Z7CGM7_9LAMI|nr:hypothetical protein F511_15190 [Dorcoceras hygrometricum]
MARKKITIAYLSNRSERKASFKKRNKGLMKKVGELSTLCGVDACAITYSEFQLQPEVWPSPPEARRVLERFMEQPDLERNQFMQTQMSLTRQLIEKTRNKLRRQQTENKRKELTIFMFQCIEGNTDIGKLDVRDRVEMNIVIDDVLREITERMEQLKASGKGPSSAYGEGTSVVAAAAKGTGEVPAQPEFVEVSEDPPGFSYLNILMIPIDGVADFAWNNMQEP